MRKLLKLLIIAIAMFGTCSCVKVNKEYYMKHNYGLWISYKAYNTYKTEFRVGRASTSGGRINTLYIYSATDGTYTIKEDPAFNDDPSLKTLFIHNLRIKILPDDGKLEEGMVFSVEDSNLEMTAIYSSSEEDYHQTATTGELIIDRIYDDNSVQGRFEFSEDELWEYSEGVFILQMRRGE